MADFRETFANFRRRHSPVFGAAAANLFPAVVEHSPQILRIKRLCVHVGAEVLLGAVVD
jgi:hypothetical protein